MGGRVKDTGGVPQHATSPAEPSGPDRRTVISHGVALAAAPLFPVDATGAQPTLIQRAAVDAAAVDLTISVNGRALPLKVDARTSLLDLVRDRLALFGTKKGCDHGQCGACTVHVNGRRVASCLTLAAKVNGQNVTTIEGLSDGVTLHPMQQAFIDHDALQCGYCTPGQIMAAVACVAEGHATSREQIREYMSGNICRCGAYVGIVTAIEEAASKMRAS